jgi:hypothetical protein
MISDRAPRRAAAEGRAARRAQARGSRRRITRAGVPRRGECSSLSQPETAAVERGVIRTGRGRRTKATWRVCS